MEASEKSNKEEHILACLSPSPSNVKIIKTAAQMAKAFGARFTALYVKTPTSESLSRENRERLQRVISLAEELGAEIATVYGEDVADQIIEFARLSGVTKLVLGRSVPQGSRLLRKQALTDKIIKAAGGLDIHIIPDGEAGRRLLLSAPLSAVRLPSLRQSAMTLLLLFLSTALGFGFHALRFTEANTITVYMLGALLTALLTKNYLCSGLFSLASVLLFNFFFTEPRLSFIAYESGYPVTFAIMLIASLLTGTLANRLATNARLSANAAYRTGIMFETNRLLQKAESEAGVIDTMARQLGKLLSRSIAVYPVKDGVPQSKRLYPLTGSGGIDAPLLPEETALLLRFCEEQKQKREESRQEKKTETVYFPVKTEDTVFCLLGIETAERGIEHFESSILHSILGEAALAIEGLRNAKEKEEIALLAKNEQLRANLLRAISHDLRTPLTSISGNAENLLANFEKMDKETRDRLLTDVNEDAEWLILLVENLLSVSRISEGRMDIRMSAQLADEVIEEALRHSKPKAASHHIKTDFGEELLLASMDARLISQVIINLVDNARKYTPEGSLITVKAESLGEEIAISVADNGPGIEDEHKADVFRMFYTGKNQVADCRRSLGLGLSLCQSIINAHGSELILTDNHPHGCIFTFTLKKSEVTLDEQ